MRGDALEQQIDLGGETVHIGRGISNEVILDDHGKSVSREHAEIRLQGDRYVLVDLQSQNGIWAAGIRMPHVVLEPGVVVTIGPYQLALDSSEDSDSGPMTMHAPLAADATYAGVAGGGPVRAAASGAPAEDAKVSAATRRHWSEQYRTLLIAGVVAVAVGGGAWAILASRNRPANADEVAVVRLPEPEQIPAPPPADVTPPPPAPLDVTSVIQEVRQALSNRPKDCAAAQEGLDRILAVQSENPELSALKRDVANCRQGQRPAPAPQPVGGGQTQGISPEQGGLAPLPNETNVSYSARIGSMEGRFRDADALLARDDLHRALSQFEAIAREAGTNYRYRGDANSGVTERVSLVRSRLKEAARKQFESAAEMVRTRQFDRAVEAYRQAGLDDATLPVDAALERLNTAKVAAGHDACNMGRILFGTFKPDEAAKQYDLAAAWLPPTDPCYAVANERKSSSRAPR